MTQIVGLKGNPLETIKAGVLMILFQEFNIIINTNRMIEFTVRYAIDRTAKKHHNELVKIKESIDEVHRKHCVVIEGTSNPVLDEEKNPKYQEGVTKEQHTAAMQAVIDRDIPFEAFKIPAQAMQGVILDQAQSKFDVFQAVMIYDGE